MLNIIRPLNDIKIVMIKWNIS